MSCIESTNYNIHCWYTTGWPSSKIPIWYTSLCYSQWIHRLWTDPIQFTTSEYGSVGLFHSISYLWLYFSKCIFHQPSNFFTYTSHHPSVQIITKILSNSGTIGAVSSNTPGGGVFLGALAKLLKATITFVVCLSVRVEKLAVTGRIFHEI